LTFNLSHSNHLAVYAFSRGRDLGVDVEQVRSDIDHRALADRFFAPGERADVLDADAAVLAERFFACWTRKEAVAKAHGAGLSLPLDSFEVSVDPDVAPRLEWRTGGESDSRWRLETFRPRPGFIGSVASHGDPANVVFRSVDDLLGATAT
jgi:4'-phosphopantetheinyl transferase